MPGHYNDNTGTTQASDPSTSQGGYQGPQDHQTTHTHAHSPNSAPNSGHSSGVTVSHTVAQANESGTDTPDHPSITGAEFSNVDSVVITDITSKTIERTFGYPDDYIECHIYNESGALVKSEYNFKDYTVPPNQDCAPLTRHIDIDTNAVLLSRGYNSGVFKLKFNFLKTKIFDTSSFPFQIKQISSDRREIRSICTTATNATLKPAVSGLISEIESSTYFREYFLNLGGDVLIPIINLLLDNEPYKHELLLKTLNPLNNRITSQTAFKIVEEIADSIEATVDLGDPPLISDKLYIRGPNFNIDIKHNLSIPSGFKSYDELLSYNVTSSYEHLLSKLEDFNSAEVKIAYDYIRPVSSSTEEVDIPYHFENFTHFSSATERLKNFEYKLKLIELYHHSILNLESTPDATSASAAIRTEVDRFNHKRRKIIQGFDGYEQFLYFESGTYSWPKQNEVSPYDLYSITSSEARTWLGSEKGESPDFGGQILSASLFDKQNDYNLNKLIPLHIADSSDNSLYVSLVNMIGQHFDNIWTYIKSISDIYDKDNSKGISKDLVYYQLKSLGIETFDQFENAALTEYMLGVGSGSNTYNVGFHFGEGHYASSSATPSETLITASNSSIPKQDISKEIWKRLYHNSTYILKTKGTERGIKALMSCYGLPSTILNIKEYGGATTATGPLKDLDISDHYKTFTYPKTSLALKGNTGIKATDGDHFFIHTKWSSDNTLNLSASAKTVEFRIKPKRSEDNQVLFLIYLILKYNQHLLIHIIALPF